MFNVPNGVTCENPANPWEMQGFVILRDLH